MYKKNLALNNLQWLICHKITPEHTPNTSAKVIEFVGIKKKFKKDNNIKNK